MALAVALLAALTGASNHIRSDGDGQGQPLAVGIADDHPAAAGTSGATGTTEGAAGAAAAAGRPTTTLAGAAASTGTAGQATTTTTIVDAAAAAAAGADESGGEGDGESDDEPEPDATPTRVEAVVEPPPPPPPPVPVGLTRQPNVELEVLTLTNMDRGNNGVPPVNRDGCLDAEASAWAHAMAESVTMAHSAGGGGAVQGCRGSNAYWGDNVGYWQPCYASEMEAWWMNSPSHRPHILDTNFTAVGIGVWAEPSGRCWFQVYFGS